MCGIHVANNKDTNFLNAVYSRPVKGRARAGERKGERDRERERHTEREREKQRERE